MSDAAIHTLASIVIAAQLILPLAAGAPILLSKKLADEMSADKRRARRERRSDRKHGAKPPNAKKLAPLKCASCGSPVPLEGEVFPCRHCHAEVTPPAEYVAALRDRAATADQLVKAERMWRWSRWTSSPLLLWPLRIAVIAWLALVIVSVAWLREDWPKMVLFLAVILAMLLVLVGLAWISGMARERNTLPALPTNDVFAAPAADGTCTTCGASVHFHEGRVAMLCLYCATEAYRVEAANAEAQKAKSDHAAASQSLLDAMVARRDRRNELLLLVAFMGIAEIFYAVVFVFAAVADFVGC